MDRGTCEINPIFDDDDTRKEDYTALSVSEKRLWAMVHGSPIGIGVVDRTGLLTECNDALCSLVGYSREELLGNSFEKITHPEDLPREWALINQLWAGERNSYRLEKRYIRKDGSSIWVDVTAALYFDEEGAMEFGYAFVRDITERKEHERRLEESRAAAERANKAKDRFLATVSHEIRTPMSGVLGMLQLLIDTQLTDEQSEYVRLAEGSAKSLLTVINDILDLSKIESGRLVVHPRDFSPAVLTREVAEMFEMPVHGKGINLQVDVDSAVPDQVHGDSDRIRQILVNLTGNALKYTRKGGITLRVYMDRGGMVKSDTARGKSATIGKKEICFQVCDTGVGIPPRELDQIFESFYQVSDGTSTGSHGTGLGLSISRQLAELMGGTLTAESTKGEGSVFTLRIPVPIPPVPSKE